jgi:hypothetical protein
VVNQLLSATSLVHKVVDKQALQTCRKLELGWREISGSGQQLALEFDCG